MHVDHLIVGAGFAGLCAAIKLHQLAEFDPTAYDVRRPAYAASREDVSA